MTPGGARARGRSVAPHVSSSLVWRIINEKSQRNSHSRCNQENLGLLSFSLLPKAVPQNDSRPTGKEKAPWSNSRGEWTLSHVALPRLLSDGHLRGKGHSNVCRRQPQKRTPALTPSCPCTRGRSERGPLPPLGPQAVETPTVLAAPPAPAPTLLAQAWPTPAFQLRGSTSASRACVRHSS